MKNLKKTLVMVVSLALVAALAIGGTVAYLTVDPQSENNVFSVGDINIALSEKVNVEGAGKVSKTGTGAEYTGVMPGDYLQKEVTVENTGSNPAYVAVEVTINNADLINKAIDEFYEAPSDKAYTDEQIQAMYDYIFEGFGMNYNPRPGAAGIDDARLVIEKHNDEDVLKVDYTKTSSDGSFVYGVTNWFKSDYEEANTDYRAGRPISGKTLSGYYADDMKSNEMRYTYYILLENKGDSVTLFKGFNVPASFNAEQLKMFNGLHVDVKASAIQADNFNGDAKAAFTALKAEYADNKNDGDIGDYYVVATADELATALENGGKVQLAGDIQLTEATKIPEGVTVNLDMNGKKISGSATNLIYSEGNLTISGEGEINATREGAYSYAIRAQKGSLVVDGDITVNGNFGSVEIYNGSNVTINAGSYKAAGVNGMTSHTVYVSGSTLNVYGGTFDSGTSSEGIDTIAGNSTATVNLYDGMFSASDLGKNFFLYNVTVYGGTYDCDPTTIAAYRNVKIADGYEVIQNADGTYTVSKKVAPDGTTLVSEGLYVDADGVYYITNAAGFDAMREKVAGEQAYEKDGTWILYNDIDLNGVNWTPIAGFHGTFDGNDKTISNMNASFLAESEFGGSDFGVVCNIKDVTFHKATITGTEGVGVVVSNGVGVTIENVKVTNSTVIGTKYVGGIVGVVNKAVSTITGCSVTDSTIKAEGENANGKVGGIVGFLSVGKATGNTVTGCTISGPECVGGIAGRGGSGDGSATIYGNTVSGNTVTGTDTATVGEIVGDKLNVKESE